MPSNPGALLSVAEARHLLRRTGFGASPAMVGKLTGPPVLSRSAAADLLLNFAPTRFKPRGKYVENIKDKWVKYMVSAKFPLQEKLVLFWHDHFATRDRKSVV